MNTKARPSKSLTWFSLGLFFLLIWNTSFATGVGQDERKAQLMFSEGIELAKSSEHIKAIERFSQVLVLSNSNILKADACFQLSLCNFHMGEKESAGEWIKRCLENNPGKEISAVYPSEYAEMFNRIKRDMASSQMKQARRVQDAAAQIPPSEKKAPPAVTYRQSEPPKKSGGSKTILFILGGVLVAGGLAFLLLKGKDESTDTGTPTATTGSISVNSTPSGADIFLDGTNTGQETNATLTDISPGSHTISLKKDGYEDHEASVSVTAGQTANVTASLTAHTITVSEPAAGSSWAKGSKLDIAWDSNASVSANQVNLLVRRLNPAMSPAGHLARMRVLRSRGFNRSSASGNRGSLDEVSGRAAGTTLNRASKIQSDRRNAGSAAANKGATINPSPTAGSGGLINGQTLIAPLGQNSKAKPQAMDKVKIELLKEGGLWKTIAASTDNDGSHSWNIPASIDDGGDYSIRISNTGDGSVHAESGAFSIVGTGKIRVNSTPKGATIYLDGKKVGNTTNATLSDIPVGKHTVRLVLNRYQDWDTQVQVRLNQTVTVKATLEIGSFTDNFDNGNSSYWNKVSKFGQWQVNGGIYTVKMANSGDAYSYYNLGSFHHKYSYEFTTKRMAGDNGSGTSLLFGGNKDMTEFYIFNFYQDIKAYMVLKGEYDPRLALIKVTGFFIAPELNHPAFYQNDWNTIKLVADGKNFSFYANGKFLDSVTISDAPTSGRIGIAAKIRSSIDKAGFDDISLQYGNLAGSVPGRTVVPQKIITGKNSTIQEWFKVIINK